MACDPTTIESIMTRHVVQVPMDATLEQIRALFDQHRFHHVIVTEHARPVGVISDRDILKHLSPYVGTFGESPRDTATLKKKAHQIMSRQLVPVTLEATAVEACAVMLAHEVSCLPVVGERGDCVGIVTWRDLLRWCMGSACGSKWAA